MTTLTAKGARASLVRLIDQTAASHQPVFITGKRNRAVLLSAEDWQAIQEMLHLPPPAEPERSLVMDRATHNRIISFVWDIADAVLRDLFKRGKYEPDAWVNNAATKIGYEVSVTRHFYKPQPLRMLAEISADILAVEKETEGLLDGLLVEATQP